jgi:hypothetical protein
VAVLSAAVAVADDGAADRKQSGGDSELEHLRALLDEQQRQIDELTRQVTASTQGEMDAQRTQIMRDQIRAILSDAEFRESLMPTVAQAGYDNGFYIKSSDDKFLLRINGLFQFGWTHYATRADNRYLNRGLQRDDRTGFDIRRLRLRFTGNVHTKDLTYSIELQQDAPDRYDTVVNHAFFNYRVIDEFQILVGNFRVASTAEQLRANETHQMIDRSLADTVFGFGSSIGVRFWGQLFEKKLDWYLDIVNGLTDGENNHSANRTITNDPAEIDGNPALLFRTVWHILGDKPGTHFIDQSDLAISENPAWDLAFHYAYNEDRGERTTTRIPFPLRTVLDGGFGLTTSRGLQFHQFGFDTAFKWRGFSATGLYVLRILDVRSADGAPFTPLFLLTGDGSTNTQHGGNLQLGYFLPIAGLEKKLEVVGRIGGVSTLAHGQEGTWEYGGGLNYYIDGNRVKLQMDAIKISEVPITSQYTSLANVNDDALIFRVQLQVAF